MLVFQFVAMFNANIAGILLVNYHHCASKTFHHHGFCKSCSLPKKSYHNFHILRPLRLQNLEAKWDPATTLTDKPVTFKIYFYVPR